MGQEILWELFGWKMDKMSPLGRVCGDYWYFNTTEKKDGTVCGGIMKRQCAIHGPTIYFGVDSLEEATRKVQELGGKIVMEKTAVHGRLLPRYRRQWFRSLEK